MVSLLDHGSLEVIETWGSDEMVVETARVSTQKGFLGWGPRCAKCGGGDLRSAPDLSDHPGVFRCGGCQAATCDAPGDEKLLRFLYDNKHSTPFEFAGLTIEIQAPIFVFREWHRHRTQSFSEASARYAPLPDVNYIPTVDRCMATNTANRQANAIKGADELTTESALEWLAELADAYDQCERVYQSGLRRGIPKEVARLPVPVGRYSRMRATANLRNWLGFMTLRSAPNAQYEIRVYSNAVGDAVAKAFPQDVVAVLWDGCAMTPAAAIAQLRHAYAQAHAGLIGDQRAFATGLLGPAIEAVEPLVDDAEVGRLEGDASTAQPIARIEVIESAGYAIVFVNGFGAASWDATKEVAAGANGLEYAREVARALRVALKVKP